LVESSARVIPKETYIKKSPKFLLWLTVIGLIILFIIFFLNFFINIEKFIRTSRADMVRDWGQQLIFYGNIKHQVFTLKKVPYHHPYIINGSDVLFSNPQTSVLAPVNLLLPFTSIYHFFIFHLSYHYIIAIIGLILIRKFFKLPYFALFPMFFLFGLNGRILSNYYIGHTMFITYLYFPLLLYLYFCLIEKRRFVTLYAASTALVLTLVFFEGGIYFFNWMMLFFFFDILLVVINILINKTNYISQPQHVLTNIFIPVRNIIMTIIFVVLFSAIKLLPVLYSFRKYNPSFWRVLGYKNILFFFQTFYQPGLGSAVPFKELWFCEAYNFIGIEAFILALLSIFYSLFIVKNSNIKRLAIIGITFSILSFGDIYYDLFGSLPILKGIRVHSRFTFITLAILAILIPYSINHFLLRVKASRKLREIVMLMVGSGFFLRLYIETKKWMIPSETQFDLSILLSKGNGGGIEQYFYIGLAITILSILGTTTFVVYQKRKSTKPKVY